MAHLKGSENFPLLASVWRSDIVGFGFFSKSSSLHFCNGNLSKNLIVDSRTYWQIWVSNSDVEFVVLITITLQISVFRRTVLQMLNLTVSCNELVTGAIIDRSNLCPQRGERIGKELLKINRYYRALPNEILQVFFGTSCIYLYYDKWSKKCFIMFSFIEETEEVKVMIILKILILLYTHVCFHVETVKYLGKL